MKYDLITILGPTASGKTVLAVALAYELKTEIISGDSRQVYRRMDLGTGKDLKDYVVDGHFVPYHLIDIVEPGTKYNLFEYLAPKSRTYCFAFCSTVQVVIVNTVVLLLGLVHLLNRWTMILVFTFGR